MADKIDVQGKEITIISRERQDYISLTDIAKYRNSDAPADIVKNWMRSRSTIEFLGLWEQLNNADFKLVEFDQFRNEAGANHLPDSHRRDQGEPYTAGTERLQRRKASNRTWRCIKTFRLSRGDALFQGSLFSPFPG